MNCVFIICFLLVKLFLHPLDCLKFANFALALDFVLESSCFIHGIVVLDLLSGIETGLGPLCFFLHSVEISCTLILEVNLIV